MDKNTYETYEFLPSNTNETEPDQFFVVQDDGTFLLNRQIQYVAQVQDVKEVLEDVQPCTVYGVGVSSQQFFVDVDNSAELISVSDQFMLPDGENGLYANSYLLQPSSSTTTEQIEDVVVDQFKEPNTDEVDIDLATHNSKQGNNFTEITLSDEQYQTLEQRGWILLESNGKIFVLNTLGLHDITTNDKLIQKLKNEIQSGANTAIDSGTIKVENASNQFPNLVAQTFTHQQDTVEFVIGSNEEQDENIENLQFVIGDTDKANADAALAEDMYICDSTQESELQNNINEIATIKQESINNTSSIKINTKFNFKDIPEKIFLGKTVNGKRLVARVVKSTKINNNNNSEPPAPNEAIAEKTVNEKVVADNQPYINAGIRETELVSLIQQSVRSGAPKPIAEDITSAENVIAQLLKVPNLKSSLIGHNLIITKAKNCKDESGVIYNKGVALVTGHVTEKEDSPATFEHLPDMLQTIKSNSEEAMSSENQHLECIDHEKEICTIFHVHITETKGVDSVVRVSVTLNKRQLSINQMFAVKKRHPNTVFACSACAALFKSEEALKGHQDNDCLDADDMLTIDMGKTDMVDAYAIIRTEKDNSYSCSQCNANFLKLYSCVRHVKTHMGLHKRKSEIIEEQETSNEQSDGDAQKKGRKEVYKCKMCRSTYFHPATLSKHIVARHIKVKK